MVAFLDATPLAERSRQPPPQRHDTVLYPAPTSGFLRADPLSQLSRSSSVAPPAVLCCKWYHPLIEGHAPSPRGGHTASLVDDRLVVFGGHTYGGAGSGFVYHNDLHVLHLRANKWMDVQHRGTPPTPRYGHSAARAGQKIIFFGGRGKQHAYFNDLHALDVETYTWLQGPPASAQPSRPSARFGHSCNVDAACKHLYVFGGVQDKHLYNDCYFFNLETMEWTIAVTKGIPPTPRFGHAALVVTDYLLICGGMHRVQLEPTEKRTLTQKIDLKDWYTMDLAALELETFVWHRVRTRGPPPQPRFGHSLELVNGHIVLFGGWGGWKTSGNTVTAGMPSDASRQIPDLDILPEKPQMLRHDLLSSFNTNQMMWEACLSLGNAPKTRYGHTCTRVGSKLIIFGGWDATISLNDVVVLSACHVGDSEGACATE